MSSCRFFLCSCSENSHFISHQTTCYKYPAIQRCERECRGSFGTKSFREQKLTITDIRSRRVLVLIYVRARSRNSQYQQSKYLQGRDEISLIKIKMRSLITFHIYREVLLRRFEYLFYRESSTTSYSAKNKREHETISNYCVSNSSMCIIAWLSAMVHQNERHKTTFRHKVSE